MKKITARGLAKYMCEFIGFCESNVEDYGFLRFDSKNGFYALSPEAGATNIACPVRKISISHGDTVLIGKNQNHRFVVDLADFDSADFCRKELKKLLKCSDKALDSLVQKISQFIQ
jgi:hypothetical protein